MRSSSESCVVADQLLGLEELRLFAVVRVDPDAEHPRGLLHLTVQTDRPELVACRTCGVFEHGRVHARLLDVTLGRSGPVYAAWIRAQTREFVDGITHASLDPFRGYANAIRSELPDDTVTVLDAFHVVKLASTAMDEVRRRVQQATRPHPLRGRPAGP